MKKAFRDLILAIKASISYRLRSRRRLKEQQKYLRHHPNMSD